MPGLARTLEDNGLVTLFVTMMPYWAEKTGVPRTLAVEYPFGQTLGKSGDSVGQRRLIIQALTVIETAATPGKIVHSPETWHEPVEVAVRAWQPAQPSPVVQYLAPRLKEMLRKRA